MAFQPWTTKEFRELGVFCWNYYQSPQAADPEARSSFREDIIIGKLAERSERETIRVLDACCGRAVLAFRMLKGFDKGMLKRLAYWCFDHDKDCIDFIEAQKRLG